MRKFGYYNELHRYNERKRSERMDAVVVKGCVVLFVALMIIEMVGG